MNVGSLFSGAGLLDWGLTQAGFDHAWFCESDAYCRSVLARRWPDIPIHQDIRTLTSPRRVDLLCGGFPCQDVSVVGRRAGIGGEQSGLWTEFARLIRDLRPRYVLVENVPGLLVRGMGVVLGDLAACGYDAEWDCLPAAAFGAPHLRARIFLLAYPNRGQRIGQDDTIFAGRRPTPSRGSGMADANGEQMVGPAIPWSQRDPWATEPDVGRVANGVPARVDRLRALGNGVVPQISRWIGERILEAESVKP